MRGTTWAAFQSYSVLYTAHKELPNILRLVSGPTRTCESNAEVRVRHVGRPFLPSLRSSYSSVGKASNCSTTLSVQAIFQSYKWRDMLEVMICIFCQHSVIPAGHIRTSHEMTQSQTSQSWFKFKIFYNIAPYLHAKKSWSFVKPLGLFYGSPKLSAASSHTVGPCWTNPLDPGGDIEITLQIQCCFRCRCRHAQRGALLKGREPGVFWAGGAMGVKCSIKNYHDWGCFIPFLWWFRAWWYLIKNN